MKRIAAGFLLLFLGLTVRAQEAAKTGWEYVPLPNVNYNSDLGLSLGAFCDFFYYGDGTIYPNFLHHGGITGTYSTKGSWYLHGYFESIQLIPGLRISASATYRDAEANSFYGFNGIAAPFDPELDLNKHTRTAWYTNHRRFVRVATTFQGPIAGKLNWVGGAVFRHVMMADFQLNNYDSGKSLFMAYKQAGLIHEDEFAGGTSLELKGGLSYDTRDVEMFPTKGAYGELILIGNGDLKQWKYNYLQVAARWKQFISLIPDWLIFAYQLCFQHTLAGEIPYYNLNELATIHYLYEENSGLGSRYSIRGYNYNRISAAGYAWTNLEFRVIPWKFKLFKQNFRLVLNPFMDLAAITKTYRLEQQMQVADFYQSLKRPVMASAGCGIKLHMNTNFILSLDFAKAFDPQLSNFMIVMATTYVF